MILHYIPNNQITIDGIVLKFSERRDLIREKLKKSYQEDNQVIQIGHSSIDQRRDIYKDDNYTTSLFFLGYDRSDLLSEIEVHHCDEIRVLDTSFDFEEELESVALKLGAYSPVYKRDDGEFFFKDLKIVIMNETRMGGHGSSLGYFYCASDVTHLEE